MPTCDGWRPDDLPDGWHYLELGTTRTTGPGCCSMACRSPTAAPVGEVIAELGAAGWEMVGSAAGDGTRARPLVPAAHRDAGAERPVPPATAAMRRVGHPVTVRASSASVMPRYDPDRTSAGWSRRLARAHRGERLAGDPDRGQGAPGGRGGVTRRGGRADPARPRGSGRDRRGQLMAGHRTPAPHRAPGGVAGRTGGRPSDAPGFRPTRSSFGGSAFAGRSARRVRVGDPRRSPPTRSRWVPSSPSGSWPCCCSASRPASWPTGSIGDGCSSP